MEVVNAEVEELENWNMFKEMTLKEYFLGCIVFPTKGCPDRSFSHLTLICTHWIQGWMFLLRFCSRNKSGWRCQLKHQPNCRNPSNTKDHVEKLKWLLDTWRFQFAQPLAFSTPPWQGTRSILWEKNNIGSLIIGEKRKRCLSFTLFLISRKNLSPVRERGTGEFGSITHEAAQSHLVEPSATHSVTFHQVVLQGTVLLWVSAPAGPHYVLINCSGNKVAVYLSSSPFLLHVSEMKFRF